MKRQLSREEKEEFKDILESLAESLDITQSQFDKLATSYKAVGDWLQNDSELKVYRPTVTPQGSLRLGTIIQPINPEDDLDVDLVFRLSGKAFGWTQKDLKDRVGARLKGSGRYAPMLEKDEGRRCWTLLYRDNAENPKEKYHMDILPAVVDNEYGDRVIKLFSGKFSDQEVGQIAIRITDKKSKDYTTSTRIETWLKSNPDGYALWFADRCRATETIKTLSEAVIPVGTYNPNKTILQRIVQILKRHRDMMFQHDKEDKPISIIITTLAAKAYQGESDLVEGLINVVENMERGIVRGKDGFDWISNPVNPEENFADKWPTYPQRRVKFYKWLEAVKRDVDEILGSTDRPLIHENLVRAFGKQTSDQAATLLAERRKRRMATGAVLLGSSGKVGAIGKRINTTNTFYGK